MARNTAVTQKPDASKKKRRLMKKIWRYRYLYLMLLLPMAFYLVFCYWPMYGLQIAFKDYNIRAGITGSSWAEPIFQYFEDYLTDPYFWKVVRNTLLLNFYSLIFAFPAPIILALL